ncbi:MAG: discoidin domain-containing protein [Kiritimatiellales bacterium]
MFFSPVSAILVTLLGDPAVSNLCLNTQTAYMSALQGWGNRAEYAIDGDPVTKARAEYAEPWDLTIDLETQARNINRIVFYPGTDSYATSYGILISDDNRNWTPLVVQNSGAGSPVSYSINPSAAGRYIKVDVSEQNGTSSHIIQEVEVWGNGGRQLSPYSFSAPERPEILFKLIVGRETDFLWKYKGDTDEIFSRFERVYDSVQSLLDFYNLSFVINPSLFYSNTDSIGYGRDVTPIYTVDPDLILLLDELEDRSCSYAKDKQAPGFHLMVYSSDVSHQQEDYDLSLPPLNRWDYSVDGRKGMSMDLQTVRDLKFRYPRTLRGIVFHELLGSNRRWLNNEDGGIPKDDEAVQAWVDLCRTYGLELVWADPKWTASGLPEGNSIYVNDENYESNMSIWSNVLDYARTVGGSNVVFVMNNNNLNLADSLMRYGDVVTNSSAGVPTWLQFDLPFKQHPVLDWADQGFRWGRSLQDWFWESGVKNYGVVGWVQNHLNPCMPIEIVSAGMGESLSHGASVVYLESPGYYWNGPVTTPPTVDDSYEPTFHLKRFVSLATNIQNDVSGTNGINFYFDSDTQRMSENSLLNPPDNYYQNTLILYRTDGPFPPETFDCYNDSVQFHEYTVPSVPTFCFTSQVSRIMRIENYGCGLEGLLVERPNISGGRDVELYALNGHRKMFLNDLRFNTDFVCITAANIVSEEVVTNRGDLDELIVLRNESGVLVPYVYQLYLDSNRYYSLQALTVEESLTAVISATGAVLPDPADFGGLVSVKNQVSINNDRTRPLDRLALLTTDTDISCKIQTKKLFEAGTMEISLGGPWQSDTNGYPYTGSIDMNKNYRDEVVLIRKIDDTHIAADFVEAGDSEFQKIHTEVFPVESTDSTAVAGLRRAWILQNDGVWP